MNIRRPRIVLNTIVAMALKGRFKEGGESSEGIPVE